MVLPLMLWWSLGWFPYFYSDCPWPYCKFGLIIYESVFTCRFCTFFLPRLFLHFRNLLLLNKVVETDNSEIGLSLRKTPNMLQPLQNPQQSLQMQIQWATVGSLEDWYNCLFDKMPLETNRLLKLKNITEMVNFLTNDLRETCGKFQKHFQDCLGLDYSR